MLVPVIGLMQVGLQAMADRYTYLPQIGLCIAVTWSAVAVGQKLLSARKPVGQAFLSAENNTSYLRWVYAAVSLLLIAGLMACGWHQTSLWRNSETIWTHTLAHDSQRFRP